MIDTNGDGRIELPERFGRHVEPGDDASRFRQQHGARLMRIVHGRFGGDVACPDILGERAAHELAIRIRRERLECSCVHTCDSGDGGPPSPSGFGGTSVSSWNVSSIAGTSANERSRTWAAARKSFTAGIICSKCFGNRTLTGALIDFFCIAFPFRTSPRASRVMLKTGTARSSPPLIDSTTSSGVGHFARCTDPGCHHDHTSSVTNGRNGANSLSSVDSATSMALFAEAAPAAVKSPYRLAFTSSR